MTCQSAGLPHEIWQVVYKENAGTSKLRSLGIFLTVAPVSGTKPYSQKFIDLYLNSN